MMGHLRNTKFKTVSATTDSGLDDEIEAAKAEILASYKNAAFLGLKLTATGTTVFATITWSIA